MLTLLQAVGAVIAGLVLAVACLMLFAEGGVWSVPITLLGLALVGSAIFAQALLPTVFIVGCGVTAFSYVVIFVLALKSQLKSG